MMLRLLLCVPGVLGVLLWLLASLTGASERTLGMVDAIAFISAAWIVLAFLPLDGGAAEPDAPKELDALPAPPVVVLENRYALHLHAADVPAIVRNGERPAALIACKDAA